MNDQILSQDEVDALLQGITGDGSELDADAVDDGGLRAVDLGRDDRIVREHMPTLEVVNERFARNIRVGLYNFIRRNAEVSVGPVSVQKYGNFLREIVVPTNFNIVAVKPLRGSGMIVCEPTLVFAVIDSLFGGSGKFHARIEGRDFSATEQRIIARLVEVIIAGYRAAWQGVYPLELEFQRSEMQPQFATIATANEMVVTTSFSLEIGETTGTIHFCFPYATLEPIRDTLYSPVQGETQAPDRRWVKLMTEQIQSAEVELVAELARADTTVEQLLALKAGDFIELDLKKAIQGKVVGVPVFDCHYGTSTGKYAIKIDRLLTSSSPELAGRRHRWLADRNAADDSDEMAAEWAAMPLADVQAGAFRRHRAVADPDRVRSRPPTFTNFASTDRDRPGPATTST